MKQKLQAVLLLITFAISIPSVQAQTAADSLAITQAHWHRTRTARGIHTLHAQFPTLYGGAQDIYIVQVNLRCRHLQVANHQGRALTTQVAATQGAVAAINGTYFDMTPNGRSVCLTAQHGKAHDFTGGDMGMLSNGALVLTSHHRRNPAPIIPWNPSNESALYPDSIAQSSLRHADVMVSGPLMLSDGQSAVFRDESHVMGQHPRSAIAFRGHKAYLVVVDGRDASRATGVTIPQLAHLLRVMRMRYALNLDGGGSSVLWARPADPSSPTSGILNHPSDGQERSVSTSIIVK